MAKSRAGGASSVIFANPNITKIERYRGFTTKSPLYLSANKISHALHKEIARGNVSGKTVADEYRKSSNGRALHAQSVPDIFLTRMGIDHDSVLKNMTKDRLSILTNYDKMNHLLSHGTVLEKRVKTTNRYGKESPKKKHWDRFWEVKGSTYIGDRLHAFRCVICQEANNIFSQKMENFLKSYGHFVGSKVAA